MMSQSNRNDMKHYDVLGREVPMNALDREATARFGHEANSLFGVQAQQKFAIPIANIKREAAKKEVEKIRVYSNYISLGAGLLATIASSNYGLPVSLTVGAISALATHFTLPPTLDKLEKFLESQAQVETRLAVKAVY
jgi:hypothetical protein